MRPITRGFLAVFVASLGYGALPIFAKLAFAEGVEVLPLRLERQPDAAGGHP